MLLESGADPTGRRRLLLPPTHGTPAAARGGVRGLAALKEGQRGEEGAVNEPVVSRWRAQEARGGGRWGRRYATSLSDPQVREREERAGFRTRRGESRQIRSCGMVVGSSIVFFNRRRRRTTEQAQGGGGDDDEVEPAAWRLLALAFLCMIICSLDRVAMSVAILPMALEFGFSETTKVK